ncbi:MAG: 4'-phosphopantetheinyl transferase superfamily protein [Gammaproteobacteria bacterium]|nr:4'-phosphopantetheinyl transferase superfamily protein [Gammaproteobacteria bacterium]NND54464.1 4'-phosphopantetheinyl transferase superfamily protein [Gammaproteobacteria bacterium]
MMNNRELQRLIAGLFPDDVAVAGSVTCPTDAALLPEEQHQTTAMVAKRLREFTHGRHCARQAMQQLGHAPAPVLKHEDRSPVWPDQICGSISHTGDIAAAVVAHRDGYRSLGLDIETAEPLDESTHALILRPDERSADGAQAKLIFSAKEAIYKTLYPLVGSYLDFQEMVVEFDKADGTFAAQPHTDRVPPPLAAALQGRYQVTPDWVVAATWIRAAAD